MANVSLPQIRISRDTATASDRAHADALQRLIEGEVRFGRHDRMLYATDASVYQVEPIGVAVPKSREDLRWIVAFARDNHLPLLPRGGGTSLAGQCVNRALVVDVSKYLQRVLSVDVEGRSCAVEPGVVLDHLNEMLARHGLLFGPDVATAAHATIGGMIGNNSAGARSILYGRTIEKLRSVDCILADGSCVTFGPGAALRDDRVAEITARVGDVLVPIAAEIRQRYPKTKRNSGGYMLDVVLRGYEESTPGTFDTVNLAHLICGSEGTLAVVERAELALDSVPPARGLAVVAFPDVTRALAMLTMILDLQPAAVELLDDVVLDMARANPQCREYLRALPSLGSNGGALLYIEFVGERREAIDDQFRALKRVAEDTPMRFLTDATDMTAAWLLRKAGEPLLHAVPGARKPVTFIEDTAVDPARLAAFVERFRAIVERHDTRAAYYAHASVGCLHIRPLIDLHDARDRARMRAIAYEVCDLVKEFGGAVSGEHGDGRVRSELLERFYGPRICEAFRRIKAIFDPENRLNPGNLVEPADMTANLRVQPHQSPISVPAVETYFDYPHGFPEAVEQCNGAGVCRRRSSGVMCPSYRGTLDERHATRGRGNALRLAITGQLGTTTGPAWDDPETIETLDLCLSCKACKRECPSNVDIAKLKAEFTAQRYRNGGRRPLNALMTGHVRSLNRAGTAMPNITNALLRSRIGSAIVRRVMDVDPRRSLPSFGQSLFAWAKRREGTAASDTAPTVLLFGDCFTGYNEPGIGRAAVRVLERFGYNVVVADAGCCGRAMVSVGLLDEATRTIAQTAATLQALVTRHNPVAIVGTEPSCVSAICDEWIDLRMHFAPEIRRDLAGRTVLLEHFLASSWERHPRRPDARLPGGRVIVHGHCHEKALWGKTHGAALLAHLEGGMSVETLDSGCCGMAGSFGYSPKRFDLSMAIGELTLFPAIRNNPEATVVASGTSCRHQIRDATGCAAMHPIELFDHCMHAHSH